MSNWRSLFIYSRFCVGWCANSEHSQFSYDVHRIALMNDDNSTILLHFFPFYSSDLACNCCIMWPILYECVYRTNENVGGCGKLRAIFTLLLVCVSSCVVHFKVIHSHLKYPKHMTYEHFGSRALCQYYCCNIYFR